MRIPHILAGIGLALVLTGCTPGQQPSNVDASATPGAGAAPARVTDPGTADAPTGSMAEQAIAAGSSGGTLTVTLRSVQVQGGVMTVRYAVRWDNADKSDTAMASYFGIGINPILMSVTDGAALKLYRPFCTQGSWKSADFLVRAQCESSALVSAGNLAVSTLVNHGTVEVSGLLPAPEGKPATVTVSTGENMPTFTDATVTYLS